MGILDKVVRGGLTAFKPASESSLGGLTVLKQDTPDLARRNFMKQTAGMVARQAIPDTVMDALAVSPAALRTLAPKVALEAAASTVPKDTDIATAFAAVAKRIKENNTLAKKQAAARAEAGIADMIEGHQPIIKTLRRNSAIHDDAGNTHLIEPLINNKLKAEGIALNEDGSTLSSVEELVRRLKTKPKVVDTGWVDSPTLEHTYVPGIGHEVWSPSDRMSYWIKSPDTPLHDDAIIHEYLNTMKQWVD